MKISAYYYVKKSAMMIDCVYICMISISMLHLNVSTYFIVLRAYLQVLISWKKKFKILYCILKNILQCFVCMVCSEVEWGPNWRPPSPRSTSGLRTLNPLVPPLSFTCIVFVVCGRTCIYLHVYNSTFLWEPNPLERKTPKPQSLQSRKKPSYAVGNLWATEN
jgi:hypothetical protein